MSVQAAAPSGAACWGWMDKQKSLHTTSSTSCRISSGTSRHLRVEKAKTITCTHGSRASKRACSWFCGRVACWWARGHTCTAEWSLWWGRWPQTQSPSAAAGWTGSSGRPAEPWRRSLESWGGSTIHYDQPEDRGVPWRHGRKWGRAKEWWMGRKCSVAYHGGSFYKPRLHGPSARTTDLEETEQQPERDQPAFIWKRIFMGFQNFFLTPENKRRFRAQMNRKVCLTLLCQDTPAPWDEISSGRCHQLPDRSKHTQMSLHYVTHTNFVLNETEELGQMLALA